MLLGKSSRTCLIQSCREANSSWAVLCSVMYCLCRRCCPCTPQAGRGYETRAKMPSSVSAVGLIRQFQSPQRFLDCDEQRRGQTIGVSLYQCSALSEHNRYSEHERTSSVIADIDRSLRAEEVMWLVVFFAWHCCASCLGATLLSD